MKFFINTGTVKNMDTNTINNRHMIGIADAKIEVLKNRLTNLPLNLFGASAVLFNKSMSRVALRACFRHIDK